MFTLVLLAALLNPQLGNELAYGPYTRPQTGFEPAVAAAPSGLLLAWSEVGAGNRAHIRVARLGYDSELIGAIHDITPLSPESNAIAPAVATNGIDFYLVWRELSGAKLLVCGMRVAADGTPLESTRYVHETWNEPDRRPVVVFNGDSYLVLADNTVWYMNDQGQRVYNIEPVPTPDAIATFGAAQRSLSVTTASKPQITTCWVRGCTTTPAFYDITWSIREGITEPYRATIRIEGWSSDRPAMAAATANDFVIAWNGTDSIDGTRIDTHGKRTGSFRVPDSLQSPFTSPSIACDEDCCLIAYDRVTARSSAVNAAFLDEGQLGTIVPFAVADSDDNELGARAFALGNGRFLVAYMRGPNLAGKIVTFVAPAKRRAS